MTYSSLQIANYFIQKSLDSKKPITPMKLQKLMYFAHGWYLALKKEPLLDESIEAWKYGPVIPSIYHEFKHYGNNEITKLACHFGETPMIVGDKNTIDILDLVWDLYSDLTPIQLSNMTHEVESPWEVTLKEFIDKGRDLPKGKDIDDNLISTYFSNKLTQVG